MEKVLRVGWASSFLENYDIGVASIAWEDDAENLHIASQAITLPDWGPLGQLQCRFCGATPESELSMREALASFLVQTGAAHATAWMQNIGEVRS